MIESRAVFVFGGWNDCSEVLENNVMDIESLYVDKEEARREIAWANAQMGFVPNPDATAEKARALMRAEGVRAEDNLFSRDIIRARYPEEFGEDDK